MFFLNMVSLTVALTYREIRNNKTLNGQFLPDRGLSELDGNQEKLKTRRNKQIQTKHLKQETLERCKFIEILPGEAENAFISLHLQSSRVSKRKISFPRHQSGKNKLPLLNSSQIVEKPILNESSLNQKTKQTLTPG
jgi:hypothetical protein